MSSEETTSGARVLFVDASLTAVAPFEAGRISAERDASVGTHALSPQAVLKVYEDLHQRPAPASTLLAIRGEQFELGTSLGPAARAHLARALDWAEAWVRRAGAAPPAPASARPDAPTTARALPSRPDVRHPPRA